MFKVLKEKQPVTAVGGARGAELDDPPSRSVLAQRVYEPAADCVWPSLIDLSECADVHTDTE